MDVVEIIAQFKEALAARGYSPATVKSYSQNIALFSSWLQAQGIVDLIKGSNRPLTHSQIGFIPCTVHYLNLKKMLFS
jgi:site-specific recombinase XerD